VAVKVLHPVYSRMPDLVERFRREARAASKIGHPHIVDVTDSGTTGDGSVYFVMEYLEGLELADIIDREGALEVGRALRIAVHICKALAAAHQAGIIHRDLKPENVFLTVREGTHDFVKVLDFGIAKTTEAEQARDKRLTSPGMAMGTPEYMAPEQAAGRPADERCDIYSLGAILYESLTGVPPYRGDNFMEVLTKKATTDPMPPRQIRPDLQPAVEELIQRAMARNPDDRPPTMEAFEYEIMRCLAGRGAAVAQILGMSTDPNVVAALNPGISQQTHDRGLLNDRSGMMSLDDLRTPPPMAAAPMPMDMAYTERRVGRTTGPEAALRSQPVAMGTATSGPLTLEETYVGEPQPQRSALAVFGWILLFVMLAGAVGTLLFVAAGERTEREVPTGPAGGGVTEPGDAGAKAQPADGGVKAAVLVDAGARDPGKEPGKDPGKDPAGKDPGKDPGKNPGIDGPVPKPPPPPGGPPKSRKEAGKVLEQANRARAAMDWDLARTLYQRVASSRYRKADGYVGLAKVAFENKDADAALKYAQKAMDAGATTSAWMVLGHAYFKKGRYADALEQYEKVLKKNPGDKEALTNANLARRKLGK
jgi:hypothetical protein